MHSSEKPKLVLIGGFLGSGKTTLITALGERLAHCGHRVAVVTNDQGEFLVDTAHARERGLVAGEVLGGCFCCNFGKLVEILESLAADRHPDYILAEPVGSCTDLTAAVINPLKLYHENLVDLSSYIVLADGSRLVGEYRELNLEKPVTPREVLVSHQIREASRIVLSKDDLLSNRERTAAVERIRALVPGAAVLPCSVPENRGVDTVVEWILNPAVPEWPVTVDIDYRVYAEAEAELGWYNGICTLVAENDFSPNELATEVMMMLKGELGLDAAHAKVLLTTEAGSLKMGLAGGRIQADSGLALHAEVRRAGLVMNIRAVRTPDELESLARQTIETAAAAFNVVESDYRSEALIPGEPKPTHRIRPGHESKLGRE